MTKPRQAYPTDLNDGVTRSCTSTFSDLQVRYALCYDNFGEGDFDLRTPNYFWHALSKYALEKGINLVQLTFTDITDQQLRKLAIQTGMQRMDSIDIASNIADLNRLELLVTVLQRLYRILKADDQERYRKLFAPYIKEGAGQYTYRIKGKVAVWEHIRAVGVVLHELLQQLKAGYELVSDRQVQGKFISVSGSPIRQRVLSNSQTNLGERCFTITTVILSTGYFPTSARALIP
jgi:hypothetical protein